MRIAVLNRDRCQPKNCSRECIKYCPPVRNGEETIVQGEDGKAIISEELCVGCGICVHKCPLGAIQIIGLPEALDTELVHQYGINGFRLFRLPVPREGEVVGILGGNGIGKTTSIKILGGEMIPNLGNIEEKPSWDRVLEYFAGTELANYLKKISDKGIRASIKPQYVDSIPRAFKGKVRELLQKVDDNGRLEEVAEELEVKTVLDEEIAKLSGGELQRVAMAACLLKDSDIYFFDEPSSYLDIYQRLKMARIIQALAQKKRVVVIEHDLAVLDFLADTAYMLYGCEGAYGVSAHPRGIRLAINTYLSGMMREENIRFRDTAIEFDPKPPREIWASIPLIDFDKIEKRFPRFHLKTGKGTIHHGEVVGVLGPNATGKTTFVKLLAGVEKPDGGRVER
ncbi:MAG: ribosome biogenesis/translation initiation ATPase RLI, partial [Candidatus Thermoplasmatota archaeon]|nr:ribosome biogenesis/translation initiation ATPase RLI [Candidatus Thermoplasmatota archaeon]